MAESYCNIQFNEYIYKRKQRGNKYFLNN